MSSDLSLEKRLSHQCGLLFPSQANSSCPAVIAATTLSHAFVTSHVNCNAVLAGSPKVTTDKLQRVVSNTRKFDSGLSRLLHDELHWPDVADRVE